MNKYKLFKCPSCKVVSAAKLWDKNTLRTHLMRKGSSKTYKGIRQAGKNAVRYYVCPECGKISIIGDIEGVYETDLKNQPSPVMLVPGNDEAMTVARGIAAARGHDPVIMVGKPAKDDAALYKRPANLTDCGRCQNEDGCGTCIRDALINKEDVDDEDLGDNYYHEKEVIENV